MEEAPTYTLVEKHAGNRVPGASYDVVDTHDMVVGNILQPGVGGNRKYGLYLPAVGADGRPCYRIQGPYPGTWYTTKEEALAAMPAPTPAEAPADNWLETMRTTPEQPAPVSTPMTVADIAEACDDVGPEGHARIVEGHLETRERDAANWQRRGRVEDEAMAQAIIADYWETKERPLMQVTVEQHVEWARDVYVRDEPYGDNAIVLKPDQIVFLMDESHFPEGQSVSLPQPDATYNAMTVVRHAQSWHFLQPGAELIILATDWPDVREEIRRISEEA